MTGGSSVSKRLPVQAKAGRTMGNHCLSERARADTRRRAEAIIGRSLPATYKRITDGMTRDEAELWAGGVGYPDP